MKARDFIKPGENVIVIYTHGKHFELKDDNTGSTGYWTIDPNRLVNRVIIYHRDDATNTNTLYLANHAGVKVAAEMEKPVRYDIKLTHIQYIGITTKNWAEFAESKQNPIRYLTYDSTSSD